MFFARIRVYYLFVCKCHYYLVSFKRLEYILTIGIVRFVSETQALLDTFYEKKIYSGFDPVYDLDDCL